MKRRSSLCSGYLLCSPWYPYSSSLRPAHHARSLLSLSDRDADAMQMTNESMLRQLMQLPQIRFSKLSHRRWPVVTLRLLPRAAEAAQLSKWSPEVRAGLLLQLDAAVSEVCVDLVITARLLRKRGHVGWGQSIGGDIGCALFLWTKRTRGWGCQRFFMRVTMH